MKNIFLAIILLMCSRIVNAQVQTYLTVSGSLPANYSQINNSQGVSYSGSWSYNAGAANFVQTISQGESLTWQIILPGHFHYVGLSTSQPKTKVVDDQNDDATWVGSDATVPFGILMGMNGNEARPFEGGTNVGTYQTMASQSYLRILYENATTIRYQYSTDGSNFTTFYTSAGDPDGSYYVVYQAIAQNSGINQIYKTGVAGNQPPNIAAINDVFLTQPVSSTTLIANITDPDGTISSIQWAKISGPSGGSIVSPTNDTTDITGLLTVGTYVFRVTATDDDGAQTTMDVSITVEAQSSGSGGGTTITTTVIPFSDPEIMNHLSGAEDWNFQNTVGIPTNANKQLPKSSYFRWRWFEIEDGNGVYDWTTFDRPIRAAIDNGQTFGFGIMAVDLGGCNSSWYTNKSNPSSGGTCMAYPLYLHNLMMAEAANSRPFVAAGSWIPNYNSPNFLARWKALNDSIYNHLNTTTYNGVLLKNAISYIDIRGYGTWGEWHAVLVTDNPSQWPTGRQPTVPTLDSIISYSVRAYPDLYSCMIISALDAYRLPNVWNDPAVAKFALQIQNQSGMFVGIRNDHLGDINADYDYAWTVNNNRGYTAPSVGNQQPGAPAHVPFGIDTASMNRWRLAPIIGEPPGYVTQDTRGDMAALPAYMRFWRYASFGNGNFGMNYGNPTPYGFREDSVRLASKTAGFRIQIQGGTIPAQLISGSPFPLSIQWRNAGLTPCYDTYYTMFSLENAAGQTVWSDTSSFQPRLFLPSATATTVTDNFLLPSNVPPGTYRLVVRMVDPKQGYRKMALAITGARSDFSYVLKTDVQVAAGGSNQAPVVVISGINQTNSITLPTNSVTLTSSATDPDGSISSYSWVKVSGPAGESIQTPTASSTNVTSLSQGTYVFQVTVTDNGGLSSNASITINVLPATPAPVAPSANAGSDSIVYTPKTTVTLIGSGTDPDGTIAGYQWTKVSGPPASIVSPLSSTTRVENLTVGVYVFRLTVTDNSGSTGTDDVSVTVVDPAVISAGVDRTTFSGQATLSGTVPAGTTAVQWTKISGPAGETIVSPASTTTKVTGMAVGTYIFRLTATVNGSPVTDEVTIVSRPRKHQRVSSVTGN